TVPVQMKKGRPGQLLQVLAPSDAVEVLSRVIFQETTTIGVRKYGVERTTLDREFVEVETEYGKVKIKVSKLGGEIVNFAPEFDDSVRLPRDNNVPSKRLQAAAVNAFLLKSPRPAALFRYTNYPCPSRSISLHLCIT